MIEQKRWLFLPYIAGWHARLMTIYNVPWSKTETKESLERQRHEVIIRNGHDKLITSHSMSSYHARHRCTLGKMAWRNCRSFYNYLYDCALIASAADLLGNRQRLCRRKFSVHMQYQLYYFLPVGTCLNLIYSLTSRLECISLSHSLSLFISLYFALSGNARTTILLLYSAQSLCEIECLIKQHHAFFRPL